MRKHTNILLHSNMRSNICPEHSHTLDLGTQSELAILRALWVGETCPPMIYYKNTAAGWGFKGL